MENWRHNWRFVPNLRREIARGHFDHRACADGRRCGRTVDADLCRPRYQGKLIVVDPVILASARKHGIDDQDMLHAYWHPMRVFDLDDLTMLIGPDTSARLLEIGVTDAEGVEFLVHAMAARPKFLET